MKCRQVRIYLSPYLDSELDPTTTYDLSRHLETCPDCAQVYGAEEELERAIGDRMRRPQGDEEEVIERALSHVFAPPRRFMHWGFRLVAAAALLFLLGLLTERLIGKDVERVPELITMAAEDHRRTIQGELRPDLYTADHSALAPFFQGQLAGAIGPLPSGSGWELEGARVCRFKEVRVGFVTLRYHGIPVCVVDVPEEDVLRATAGDSELSSEERCFELLGGRGIIRRTPSGLRVAFGDVEMAKLEEAILGR